MPRPRQPANPFRYFNSSPEVISLAALEEEARQRRLAAEEAARASRLADQVRALREADDIRALVARVRATPDDATDPAALGDWCTWALARADRLDPILSGALMAGFGLAGRAGSEPDLS